MYRRGSMLNKPRMSNDFRHHLLRSLTARGLTESGEREDLRTDSG